MNQQSLPNATAVLVLGILSLVSCICYGIPGIICGVIALILYSKDKKLYMKDPQLYNNYSNLNTGRILAIIGLVLGALFLAFMIFYISLIGMEALSDPELLQERMRELQDN
ncbi:CCC motif membrane protein [Chryseobacterium foetidum]|uniref:CCC motif membrane protein n=1 Tax=Chryseobacterium foetidum TaxID=2951057 RepID=UPI0021C6E03D|nr:CCC motif membrane protein [Chryseobacterium foetidum]